MGAFEAM